MKYEKQRISSAALHCISCSCVGALSSVALFHCIFSFGMFFGIIRVYTVVFSDPELPCFRAGKKYLISEEMLYRTVFTDYSVSKYHSGKTDDTSNSSKKAH